jgi:peptide/nickel transport system substrate-binding protein
MTRLDDGTQPRWSSRVLSRRVFLRGAMLWSGGATLMLSQACAPSPAPSAAPTAAKPAADAPKPTAQAAKPAAEAAKPVAEAAKPAASGAPTQAPASKPAAGAPRAGGVSTWALEADPISLDPHQESSLVFVSAIGDLVYQSLTRFDEKMAIKPALAESWEQTEPTVWTFKLRQGVKFHTGDEFTSEDVAFWHEKMTSPKTTAVFKANFSAITKVEPVDKYTVKIHLNAPYAPLLAMLAAMQGSGIAPRKWGETRDKWELEAVGTGPYRVTEYTPYSHIKFVKHKEYWEKDLPLLDEVLLKVMTEEDARISALRSGAIHHSPLSAEGARRLANDRSATVVKSPGPVLWATFPNTRRKPWDDVRVRQAVNLAINRHEAIDKVAGGEAALSGPVTPGLGEYWIPADELERRWYTPDIAKAKQLLAEAGYANGFKSSVSVASQAPIAVDAAVVLQNQLKPLGIDLQVVQMEYGTWQTAVRAFDFDLQINNWGARSDPDAYFSRSYKWKSELNYTGYGSEALDAKIDKAKAVSNLEERKKLYREIQEEILDNSVYYYWFATNNIDGFHTKLKGFYQTPLGRRTSLMRSWLEE